MNIPLLKQVKQSILDHADQFNMGSFFSSFTGSGQRAGGCGTAACIAGWAISLSEKDETLALTRCRDEGDDWSIAARKILKLPKLAQAKSEEESAQIAAEVIDNYIATEGWKLGV